MAVTVSVWIAVFVFSLLLMMFVREALALTLMFASINAIVTAFFSASLVFSACVFLLSYGVLLAAILVTNALLKRSCVNNAQKKKGK